MRPPLQTPELPDGETLAVTANLGLNSSQYTGCYCSHHLTLRTVEGETHWPGDQTLTGSPPSRVWGGWAGEHWSVGGLQGPAPTRSCKSWLMSAALLGQAAFLGPKDRAKARAQTQKTGTATGMQRLLSVSTMLLAPLIPGL
ncbi:hypothetical protein TREES_T100008514 [Tupaia chinensis]|uniref:Uncharacterized protein n=1 Tax=Tupaia chinensis TaxID=246437 RepID=L9LB55_TUPCH|nr:hypothetical protein TREES_T100008514 [Tupaia chinensis]